MRETSKQNIVTLIIILLIIGIVFIYLNSIKPTLKRIKDTQATILETREKIRLLNEYKTKAEQLMNYYSSIINQIENINLALPDDPKTSQILAILDELSKKHQITFSQVTFQELTGEDGIGRVEAKISVYANYQNLKNFLKDIEKELRLADLKDLNIKSLFEYQGESSLGKGKTQKIAGDVPLQGEMTLVFYFLPK